VRLTSGTRKRTVANLRQRLIGTTAAVTDGRA
jgi:hypothetical protein